jgi:ParB/RepB/Spo0J family partition protein
MDQFKMIHSGDIATDPLQPRKHFSEETINELGQSLKTVGFIEPCIVRHTPDSEKPYRLVCGERRCRAAEKVGITEIPCLVRELTDDQVFDIQITENLQRENPTPLDEADGYQNLISKRRCSLAEIAARFGKTEDYVFGRLKLLNLVSEAREFLSHEILPVTAAIKIATLNERQQKETIKRTVIDVTVNGVPKKMFTGLNDLRMYFDNNILIPLACADFNTKDSKLCPAAGSCTDCSKRTGNNMFKELVDGDKCLDSACYKEKHVEHYQRLQATLSKKLKVDVVYAARFYGAEREYKALGEIISMTSYNVVAYDHKAKPKNAMYAIFVGPDRTKLEGEKMPEHGWIEVTLKVVEKIEKSAEKKEANNVKQEEKLNEKFYTLRLFEHYKEKGIRAPNTLCYKLIITKLFSEYNLQTEIIVDIAKRYKLQFIAQEFDGEWSEVVVDKNYTPKPDVLLSLNYDHIFEGLEEVNHVNCEKIFGELIFLGIIDTPEMLNELSASYGISLKAAQKEADKIVKAQMKTLSK